jgi:hypothetical protein
MKTIKSISHLGLALLVAGSGFMGCTADYAYKTSLTGQEEKITKEYEGTFFAEAEEGSIISVNLPSMEDFDAINFRAELSELPAAQWVDDEDEEEAQEPAMREEDGADDNGEGETRSFPTTDIRSGKHLVGDSQNRTLSNPWVQLNDDISYRIFYHVRDNQLHLKAHYIDRNDPTFPASGKVVSKKTAEERNIMPIWDKMMSLAQQHGNEITTR